MHLCSRTLLAAVWVGLLGACASDAPVAPTADGPGPSFQPQLSGDLDGDGFALPTDCLDSGALWASGPAPCSESQVVVFDPSDGQNAKDFALVQAADGFHIFHIRGLGPWGIADYETTFGHESSDDFLQWSYHAPLDLRGPSGDWNDRNIWSPHVVAIDGVWHMFYTGVSYFGTVRETNLQRIGLATSTDLFEWTPAPTECEGVPGAGCLFDCAAMWTTWGSGGAYTGDCRDPFLLPHDGGYVLFLTTRLNDGREVIARASSPDARNWTLLDPILATAGSKAESPAALLRDGVCELYWTASNGLQVCQASDPLGNFGAGAWISYGFAAELLPAPGASYWFPRIESGQVSFRRLFWNATDQRSISLVVSPLCAIDAASVNPEASDPLNGIDDNCDGYVDAVRPALPYEERNGLRQRLRLSEAERGQF